MNSNSLNRYNKITFSHYFKPKTSFIMLSKKMKDPVFIFLICLPVLFFPQLKIEIKNPIRPIALKLNKIQSSKIENSGKGAKDLNFKKMQLPSTSASEYSINIVNPYDVPIHFAIGTNDLMRMDQTEAKGVWAGILNDYWVNFVIKTKKTELAYSIKTGNCYSFFWDKTLKGWNIRKIKCDVYEEDEKK